MVCRGRVGPDAGNCRASRGSWGAGRRSGRSRRGYDAAPGPVRMMIGGRHLGVSRIRPARSWCAIDAREVARWESPPGFFLHEFDLPGGALAGTGPLARLTVESTSAGGARRLPTAIEQFDLQSTRLADVGLRRGLARSRIRALSRRLALDVRARHAAHHRREHSGRRSRCASSGRGAISTMIRLSA